MLSQRLAGPKPIVGLIPDMTPMGMVKQAMVEQVEAQTLPKPAPLGIRTTLNKMNQYAAYPFDQTSSLPATSTYQNMSFNPEKGI